MKENEETNRTRCLKILDECLRLLERFRELWNADVPGDWGEAEQDYVAQIWGRFETIFIEVEDWIETCELSLDEEFRAEIHKHLEAFFVTSPEHRKSKNKTDQ